MRRDMFGDVVDPAVKLGSQKWYTFPLSILAHVFIFAAIIIIPLMATDVLPSPPIDDGVRGGPAAPAPASAAAPGAGRGAAEGGAGGDQPQRGAGRGAEGNQAGSLGAQRRA